MIDVHTHAIPGFLRDALDRAGRRPSLSAFPDWSPELALAAADRFGIERSVLSASAPGVHFGDAAAARDLARRFNELCADLRDRTGGRFGGFAALPLPDVEGACREAAHALDELGLEGVGLLTSYEDRFLGDPAFEPLMEELGRREAVVFLHPTGMGPRHALGLGYPTWMVEYPVATTRAALNLVMAGVTRRHPGIRWILAHSGGALPFLLWRVNAAPLIDARFAELGPDFIKGELAKFHYEIAQSPADASLGAVLETTDASHLHFGSDWPYCRAEVVEALLRDFHEARALTEAQRAEVLDGNPRRLLGH